MIGKHFILRHCLSSFSPTLACSVSRLSYRRRILTQGLAAAAFEKRLREATLVGRPLGDEQFVDDAEWQLRRTLRLFVEVESPLFVQRLSLESVLS